MKRFDPEALVERMVNNLQNKSHWNHLQEDGATYQLLEAMAEPIAEVARYGEYLQRELKWDTSRNFSSTKHMARLVGKKLNRKHSAVGTIVVSHSDVNGVPRYSYLGNSTFEIDGESDYDNLEKDDKLNSDMYTHALVPWTDVSCYSIPVGSVFTTNNDVEFICAETKTIETCNTTWFNVNLNKTTLDTFKATGGWNNYKYLIVPVVQGKKKEVILGYSDNTAGQTFLINTLDVEAADNYFTRQFCYVEVIVNGESTIWNEVQHLQTAKSTDRVFEINILDDLSGTQIKFGDSVNGAIPVKNATITLHYLETKGKEGNVTELYNFKNEILGAEIPADITKFNGLSLGCQNMWPILGGADLETLSEFKANAETAYAKNYDILHTFVELEDQINQYSPVPLIKVHTSSFLTEEKINSTFVYKNTVGITGLSTGLKPLTTTEQSVFENVLNNTLNSKVLSNKNIKYVPPSIVCIDSCLELELKSPVLNSQNIKTDIENQLQGIFGKSCLDPIDCYMQSDLLRESLNYYSNIGSIANTSLFTVDSNEVIYGLTDDKTDTFLIKFNLPSLIMDTLNREGFCDKSLADGNEVYCIINAIIAGNAYTFVVTESTSTNENFLIFESYKYFDQVVSVYNLYGTTNLLNSQKYNIQQLLRSKHTFNRAELSSVNRLTLASSSDFNMLGFNCVRSANKPTFHLLLDVETVAKNLGFTNYIQGDEDSLNKIYINLLASIDSGHSKFSVSIEPVDKTVSADWDTVMYYDNINVEINQ